MRVAIIYDCLFPLDTGGGERVYRAIADRLVAGGHDVTYVTRSHPMADPAVEFNVEEVSHGEIYDGEGARTAIGAFYFARGVFAYLSRQRGSFDVVFVSALPVLTLLAARAATLASRVTVVADWLEVWPWAKWRAYSGSVVGSVATILQWVGAHATRFNTVNSGFTAERLLRVSRRSNPHVLGLLDMTPKSTGVSPRAEPPVALFVGRLIPDKRVTTLPDAIVEARLVIPGLRLHIVGTGTEQESIEASVRRAGADPFVRLWGRVDDETLNALMSSAAVLVNPSAREGFGLVVAEAAARGVPTVVVAGEDNAAVELVESGVNGFVAADASAAVLGGAISEAIAAGPALRHSTAQWFSTSTSRRSFAASVAWILSPREQSRRSL